MASTFKGNLFGLDTKDTYEVLRDAGTYNYTLTACGGGKLSFKVKGLSELRRAGTKQPSENWIGVEDKSKISSGSVLNGSFVAPQSWGTGESQLKFTFSRAILTKGVSYDFVMHRVGD